MDIDRDVEYDIYELDPRPTDEDIDACPLIVEPDEEADGNFLFDTERGNEEEEDDDDSEDDDVDYGDTESESNSDRSSQSGSGSESEDAWW